MSKPKETATIPVTAAKPMILTDHDRTALLRAGYEREVAQNELRLRLATIQAAEMKLFEDLASRFGLDPVDIGSRFLVNLKTMRLEPIDQANTNEHS
ncbi:hypothetical protein SAMN05444166_0231 [Singulisphaera sp. GP187]|uniref:hypothetical protein n=1 Tax=Singulisphaera sp. GP187 TaxID=1882752 RepID=UPI00092B8FC6|nr:hypothetical protein [Singulisphaera sp. GP187]SIN70063.1 hypothetical protein SAMN05444166_0231 [Singulisphaera sp. GP187]